MLGKLASTLSQRWRPAFYASSRREPRLSPSKRINARWPRRMFLDHLTRQSDLEVGLTIVRPILSQCQRWTVNPTKRGPNCRATSAAKNVLSDSGANTGSALPRSSGPGARSYGMYGRLSRRASTFRLSIGRKKPAKKVARLLSGTLPLSKVQGGLAIALSYRNWHDFELPHAAEPTSPLDQKLEPDDFHRRSVGLVQRLAAALNVTDSEANTPCSPPVSPEIGHITGITPRSDCYAGKPMARVRHGGDRRQRLQRATTASPD